MICDMLVLPRVNSNRTYAIVCRQLTAMEREEWPPSFSSCKSYILNVDRTTDSFLGMFYAGLEVDNADLSNACR